MGLPWESSKPLLEADFGFQSNEVGRNKTEPCPGFLNQGLAAGDLGSKGRKVIVGTSWLMEALQALPCACQTAWLLCAAIIWIK